MVAIPELLMEAMMARKTERPAPVMSNEERAMLRALAGSQTAPVREVQRARILLAHERGLPLKEIARKVGVSRPTVYRCIDKALATGVAAALRDAPRPGRQREITDEAKAWVVSLACQKPKELGMAAELWTLSALARHVREEAEKAGFARLSGATKMTVWRILNEHELKPHRIRYYLEKWDPDFKQKMAEVLTVYREVSLRAENPEGSTAGEEPKVYSVSVDEKPGIQALGLCAPDLPPVAGQYPHQSRDYEYQRFGTLSVLAALDLHTGEIIANVERRHRSREFIALLKRLDEHYPKDAVIRIVLDNHSSHVSQETRDYLATRPGRFQYVHTPVHASWLNLVEVAFSKMARTFLRHIRVGSLDELRRRILLGIKEMNAAPVPFRWKSFDRLMSENTEMNQ